MIHLDRLMDAMDAAGLRFFTGVPDSYLNGFCTRLLHTVPRSAMSLPPTRATPSVLPPGIIWPREKSRWCICRIPDWAMP